MFYPGTKVGCCAIMHEERGGRSKEASSKGGKQRQTGLCLPVALLGLGGGLLQESQHTHTNLSFIQSHSKFYLFLLLHRQTHTLSLGRKSMHVCVRVFVRMHTWMHQCRCQSAIVQTSSCRPPAPSSTWGGRRGAQWSRRLDGGEKEKRKERKRGEEGRDGEKATKEKGQLNEKDLTAVDCHLWRPAAVKAKEFVGLWCYCPAYYSSLPFLSLSFFPLLPPLCCPPPASASTHTIMVLCLSMPCRKSVFRWTAPESPKSNQDRWALLSLLSLKGDSGKLIQARWTIVHSYVKMIDWQVFGWSSNDFILFVLNKW